MTLHPPTPISHLDRLLIRWAHLQPERCKYTPVFDRPTLPICKKQSLKSKIYLVYAPHLEQYINTTIEAWELGDWKSIEVAEFREEVDLTEIAGLMIAVIEALKDLEAYSRQQGLPSIPEASEAYPTAIQYLETLLSHLESPQPNIKSLQLEDTPDVPLITQALLKELITNHVDQQTEERIAAGGDPHTARILNCILTRYIFDDLTSESKKVKTKTPNSTGEDAETALVERMCNHPLDQIVETFFNHEAEQTLNAIIEGSAIDIAIDRRQQLKAHLESTVAIQSGERQQRTKEGLALISLFCKLDQLWFQWHYATEGLHTAVAKSARLRSYISQILEESRQINKVTESTLTAEQIRQYPIRMTQLGFESTLKKGPRRTKKKGWEPPNLDRSVTDP